VSLRLRLVLALAYVLLLAIVALEVPLALNLRQRIDDEVRSQARAQADVTAATSADLLARPDRVHLADVAASAAASVRGRVVVVDRRGRVLVDSAGPGELGSDFSARPEIAAALRGRRTQRTRHSATLNADLLATAVPIVSRGAPVGAVRVTQSVAAVNRAVWRSTLGLALIGLLVLLLGLAATLVIAEQVARPVRRLDASARRVAGGDLAVRARVEGSAEQRSLARSFNEMTARLARLIEAQRHFVADASHQLRTPLTGLRLRLEEARAASGDPTAREQLDAGMREVDRLADMVEELLVLSRAGERAQPGELVALGEAAARAVERWEATAAERDQRVRLAERAPGAAWCAPADLDRVLDVLIENALRYSPEGTEVAVSAIDSRLEVADQGPGIGSDEAEDVFARFHRGRAGRTGPSGTGLGLAIARELAAGWGAEVTLEDRPEGGTRALVSFPREASPTSP
jgi:two-component system, OmpR family, sensor kinase